MKIKAVSGIMLTLLLTSMITLALSIQPARSSGTVYIRADGSIDPPTAPISTVDNVTYTFAADVSESIVVEKDNIVVDGAGYTLQGTGAMSSKGISVSERSNVTIKNVQIRGFDNGIYLWGSSNNSIFGNKISNSTYGIYLWGSSNNGIFGNNAKNNGIGIDLGQSSNNKISGNNITANSGAGIAFWSASSNSIHENNITANSGAGISFDGSSSNSIYENNITANNHDGVELEWSSNNNSVYRNNITANSKQGIMIYLSSNNTLRGNSIADNMYNFGVWGWEYSHLVNDVDSSNTVDNKPIIYWINKQDMTVPIDAGYVTLIKCKNITVQNLNLTNNLLGALLANTTNSIVAKNNVTANKWRGIEVIGSSNNSISRNNIANNNEGIFLSSSSNHNSMSKNNVTSNNWGIKLSHSSNNTVYRNNIANNDYGILLVSSSNNSISGNDVRANNVDGIRLGKASNNTISGNTVAYNLYGIYFPSSSSDNVIYHNNFANNTNQVDLKSDSVNAWDNGIEGNYWSDYEERYPDAKELDDSGIWDTPYVIDEYNLDNYPLNSPTWSPKPTAREVPFWTQWWFWTIVATVIVASAGLVYFLKKRKTPTAPLPSIQGCCLFQNRVSPKSRVYWDIKSLERG